MYSVLLSNILIIHSQQVGGVGLDTFVGPVYLHQELRRLNGTHKRARIRHEIPRNMFLSHLAIFWLTETGYCVWLYTVGELEQEVSLREVAGA